MADPLSITVSIVALVKVGVQVANVVVFLADAGKNAPTELVELEAELSTLEHILLRVKEHADLIAQEGQCSDLDKTLENLQKILRDTSRKLTAIDKLFRGGAVGKVKFSLTWSSAKKDLQKLQACLERNKTSMLLSLQLMNLDSQRTALRDTEDQQIQEQLIARAVCSIAHENLDSLARDHSSLTVEDDDEQLQLWETLAARETEDDDDARDLKGPSAEISGGEIRIQSSMSEWLGSFMPPNRASEV